MSDIPEETVPPTEVTPATPEPPAEPVVPPDELPPDQETPEQSPGAPEGEPDTGEGGESGGTDDEPASPPEPPDESVSPEAIEKALKPVERSAKTYVDRVVAFIEETEQPIVPCGVCAAFYPGFVYSSAVVPLTEDQASWMRDALGEPDKPNLVQANDAHMCEQCDGWGRVLTGSRRPDYATRKCFGCDGRGWNGAGSQQTPVHAHAVAEAAPEFDDVPVEDSPATDPWGRTADMPGFWVMPHPGMPQELLPPSIKNNATAAA